MLKAFHMLNSSSERRNSPRFFSHRDDDTSGNACQHQQIYHSRLAKWTQVLYEFWNDIVIYYYNHLWYFTNQCNHMYVLVYSFLTVWKHTLILPKSICFSMVYICSVRSIRLAPSLQLVTSCWHNNFNNSSINVPVCSQMITVKLQSALHAS